MKRIYSEIQAVARNVEDTVSATTKIIEPVRESFFKRFPTISILLATFGVSATVYGMERIIADVAWLNERPVAIFAVGVTTLIVTGRLYKRLS
jgi:hypothetical protein